MCLNVNRFALKRKEETEIKIKNDVKYLKSSTKNLFFYKEKVFLCDEVILLPTVNAMNLIIAK